MVSQISSNDVEALLRDGASVGSIIRGERITLGKSVDEIYGELRIRSTLLESIENNDFENIELDQYFLLSFKTYAKFLGLPSDVLLERLLSENPAGNLANPAKLNLKIASPKKNKTQINPQIRSLPISSTAHKRDWIDRIGQYASILRKILPFLLFVAFLSGVIYGGYYILTGAQQLELTANAPLDSTLVQETEIQQARTTEETTPIPSATPYVNYQDLYTRQSLEIPLVDERFGRIVDIPLAQRTNPANPTPDFIGPSLLKETPPITSEQTHPVVSIGPNIPQITLIPSKESWVQISTESGNVIFEKLLLPGETYAVPMGEDLVYLRAGNAQDLYFSTGESFYGPFGLDGVSIVRNVPILPESLKGSYPKLDEIRQGDLETAKTAFLERAAQTLPQ